MQFAIPLNILYMQCCFLLLDFTNQISMMTYSTLAAAINKMNNHTLAVHFGIEPTETNISILNSIITGSSTLGMIFSLFLLVPTAETKGRKYVAVYIRFIITLAISSCHLMSALFQASELFILAQIFIGLQSPLRMFVTAMYITECAPDEYRGFVSTSLVFAEVFGQVLMFSVASPSILGNPNTWFIIPLFVLISSILILAMSARLQESPKWLVRQNRMEEAERSVVYYHGKNCFPNDVITSLIREKNLTQEDRISLREVWKNETMQEALKVLLSLSLFIILDSIAIQYLYTVLLHNAAGFTVQEAMNINLILTLIFLPTKFIGTYIIDVLGRRPVMFIAGVILYTKSWLMLCTQLIIYLFGSSMLTKMLYIIVECLSETSMATGVMSIGMLFISELFPPSARTPVAQVIILITMVISFPTISIFPILYSFFGPGFFFISIFSQLFSGTYLYRHMPETKGRAVYDIIQSLDQEVSSRAVSFAEENTPLIRKRSNTIAFKRNSILNTSRARALTYDHKLLPSKWNI